MLYVISRLVLEPFNYSVRRFNIPKPLFRSEVFPVHRNSLGGRCASKKKEGSVVNVFR